MTQTTLTLSQDYGHLMLSMSLLSIECVIFGMMAGKKRKQIFTAQFMESNFGQEHHNEVGEDVSKTYGYPDMGSGKYSQKLSYKDWLEFNTFQRIHLNFLEQLPPLLGMMVATGIKFPLFAAIVGYCYFVARIMNRLSYNTKKGIVNPFRVLSAFIHFTSMFVLFGSSVYAAVLVMK